MNTRATATQTTIAAPLPIMRVGSSSGLQRQCACGSPAGVAGVCQDCQKKKLLGKPLQTKLRVNEPGDQYEQEADRVAEQVMRMPDTGVSRPRREIRTPIIQRRATDGTGVMKAPPIAHDVLRSSGQPLDPATRAFFEPRFGHDFSQVRVHAGALAEQSARKVNADAYTVGHDIVFGSGMFSPTTFEGRRLLAHELTHVVHQSRINGPYWLQRRECSATRQCSSVENCSNPDIVEKNDEGESRWWSLTVNVDTEESDFEDALRNSKLGHTHVRFAESNGTQYSYGFYPAGEIPNENKRSVPGCVNHPDTAHDNCTDRAVTFFLTREMHQAGLKHAQEICRKGNYYGINSSGISYTCTTYDAEVTREAGKKLPSSASKPTTIYFQKVPSIDNPTTLQENLESEGRGMGTNDEVLTAVEIWGEAMLAAFHHQEKARWIRMLLEGWVSDRDVDAIAKIGRATNSVELSKIRAAVDAWVEDMNSTKQKNRVRSALGY